MKYYIVFFLLMIGQLHAQDLNYARRVVDTLASDHMKGRGYVGDGVGLAADYIAREFDRLGLQKLGKQYFQEFTSSVNSFPKDMELVVNGKPLIPGRDFLIEAGSPGLSGTYTTLTLDYADLLDRERWIPKVREAKGKLLVVDTRDKPELTKEESKLINELLGFFKYHPDNPAVGTLILTNDKLNWGGSTQVLAKPSFTINNAELDKKITYVKVRVNNQFHRKYKMRNVIGKIEGENKDSVIVLSAHFDHLGMMGSKAIFPGANDNASGVAMLLNIAQYYASNKPDYSIVFMAFAGEELGLLGSDYYTKHPLFPLEQIKFMINFDIAGTGDDGIQIVNGKVFKDEFDMISSLNDSMELLPQVKIRGESCNSDHCMFYRKGVPSFFIYTLGGIQAYHDIDDRSETLPLTAFNNYFKLIIAFIERL